MCLQDSGKSKGDVSLCIFIIVVHIINIKVSLQTVYSHSTPCQIMCGVFFKLVTIKVDLVSVEYFIDVYLFCSKN